MQNNDDMTRRDVMKVAGAAGLAAVAASRVEGAPAIQTVKAASDQVRYGVIGLGGRGSYLLKHLLPIDNGRCVAVCDVEQTALDKAPQIIGTNPQKFKDYRELLAQKNVDAVIIAVPLYLHFPVTRDAILSGKHTLLREEPGVQARRSARPARAHEGASQAGAPGGPAAPLQHASTRPSSR